MKRITVHNDACMTESEATLTTGEEADVRAALPEGWHVAGDEGFDCEDEEPDDSEAAEMQAAYDEMWPSLPEPWWANP